MQNDWFGCLSCIIWVKCISIIHTYVLIILCKDRW